MKNRDFKFDILGIKYLSVIRITLELIKERHNRDIDIYSLTLDDPDVFEMIRQGKTVGVFQMSSEGMMEVFTGLNKVDFEALSAGIALYRPGPMAYIEEYQDRANGLKQVSYPHPDLEEILSESYGIAIYQEMIMQLSQVLGGYSQGESDSLRKSMGRKSQEVMDKVLPELHERIIENGYEKSIADYAIETIEPFVGYGLTPLYTPI